MIKIILMLTSFLSLFSVPVDVKMSESKEGLVLESVGDFSLIEEESLDLYWKDQKVFAFPKTSKASLALHQGSLYVASLCEEEFTLHEFDLQGNMKRTVASQNRYIEAKVSSLGNELYVYGEVCALKEDAFFQKDKDYLQGTNAFIAKVDESLQLQEVGLYGGMLNEGFVDLGYKDNLLYAIGIKDALSGGDFGNTHMDRSVVLVELDLNLSLIRYIAFKDDAYSSIGFYDESFFLMTDTTLYELTYDLTPVRSRKIASESIFTYFSSNNTLVLFERLEAKIFDLASWEFTSISLKNEICYVAIQEEGFILHGEENTRLELLDLRGFESLRKPADEEPVLHNFFQEVTCVESTYLEPYSPLVHGTYKVSYLYGNHEIEGSVVVEPECNITSGLIYPVGYRLEFTGTAYLNQALVHYNHAITQKGFHELVLYDNVGNPDTYTFYVEEQLRFSEESKKNYDLFVYPHQEFYLKLDIDYPEGIKLTGVLLNGEEVLVGWDEKLQPYVKRVESESGPKTYQLTQVFFENEGKRETFPLQKEFEVYVLQTDYEIEGILSNHKKKLVYEGIVSDSLQLLRGFRVTVSDQKSSQDFFYSIADQDIILSYLKGKTYTIHVFAFFYEGASCYQEVELFSVKTSSTSSNLFLGTLEVVEAKESLDKFRLHLSKNIVDEVRVEGDVVYLKQESNLVLLVVASGVIGLVGCGMVIAIRKRKMKR